MAKLTKEEIIASLKEYTVLELNELVKAVEEEFGVTAAAPVAAAAPAEEEGPVAKGPTEVSLILKGLGSGSKVAIIKAVQAITGLGLMDAKKLVDAIPAPVKEHISPVEAEEHKKALVAAGAEVEIK
ncbi:MAG TPA: 50S ribosomal protein L7/L12 [Candidatus Enteromonas pullicola]|uniref:Large ribosomal subunit protein bL12 n=1 Tax=Candidatus Alloenteromonas pullicola TaxID=2840784 RepID=A0A9D1LNF4_9FIRM|nr:50S ribosomal protein L7/L12 [Candidatus Enteromonas pullicola]